MNQIERVSETTLPTKFGIFKVVIFKKIDENVEHIAITSGEMKEGIAVRIHSECFTGDTVGSLKCDCGEQLEMALKYINKNGGIVFYLRQEGRGIGLGNKIKAYALQEKGLDTLEANLELGFEADHRDYSMVAELLINFGIHSIYLMTNNPDKIDQMRKYGINVMDRIPHTVKPKKENLKYITTKINKMGHLCEMKKS